MDRPLKIALEACLVDGVAGGVQQIVIGMAQGLSQLSDGDEEYLFHVYPDAYEWLAPFLKGPCKALPARVLANPERRGSPQLRRRVGALLRGGLSGFLYRSLTRLPKSDGALEDAGCDLVHFPFQGAFLTNLPSIYQPHDLQHLHYPNFFGIADRRWRSRTYSTYASRASLIVMMTPWGRSDFLRHFNFPANKVAVIPGGAVTAEYPTPSDDEIRSLGLRFGLEKKFFIYPAKTYPHKNHMALVEALAWLRDTKGLRPQLVCTGTEHPYGEKVIERVRALGLERQWVNTGFVNSMELNALYRMATAMVFPSKFEGWGLPVTEAFERNLPVACARATSLPDHAGDAALYFDPDNFKEIGLVLERLWNEPQLRDDLIERGRLRSQSFTWKRAALIFRAWYRYLGKRSLNDEDQRLISDSLSGNSIH